MLLKLLVAYALGALFGYLLCALLSANRDYGLSYIYFSGDKTLMVPVEGIEQEIEKVALLYNTEDHKADLYKFDETLRKENTDDSDTDR